jgi:hypothetical protein
MGEYGKVKFSMRCPVCRRKITDWQTKDEDAFGDEVEFTEVNNFYSSCDSCGLWFEFDYPERKRQRKVDDYELRVSLKNMAQLDDFNSLKLTVDELIELDKKEEKC